MPCFWGLYIPILVLMALKRLLSEKGFRVANERAKRAVGLPPLCLVYPVRSSHLTLTPPQTPQATARALALAQLLNAQASRLPHATPAEKDLLQFMLADASKPSVLWKTLHPLLALKPDENWTLGKEPLLTLLEALLGYSLRYLSGEEKEAAGGYTFNTFHVLNLDGAQLCWRLVELSLPRRLRHRVAILVPDRAQVFWIFSEGL